MKKYGELSRDYIESISTAVGWTEEQSRLVLETIITSSMEMLVAPELQKRDKAQKDAKEIATKQALKNYRLMKVAVESSVQEAIRVSEDQEILLLMEPADGRKQLRLDSLKLQAAASKVLLRHIETALEEFRGICEDSPNPRIRRQYALVYDYYIVPVESSPEEIAVKHHIERSVFYSGLQEAIHTLSLLLYGINSVTDFALGKIAKENVIYAV